MTPASTPPAQRIVGVIQFRSKESLSRYPAATSSAVTPMARNTRWPIHCSEVSPGRAGGTRGWGGGGGAGEGLGETAAGVGVGRDTGAGGDSRLCDAVGDAAAARAGVPGAAEDSCRTKA